MKIGIIGASGKAGQSIYGEATRRGHKTVAIVKNKAKAIEILGSNSDVLEADAFQLSKKDLQDFDVIVDAFGISPDKAYQHVDLTAKLIAMFRGTDSPRLIFILGAGSLRTGEDKHLFVENLKEIPGNEKWISVPENQLKELDFLKGVDNVNWVGISPSNRFEPGPNKGVVLGKDELLFSANGKSHTTTGTMAVAVLDEIESPKHCRERFTVGDAE